MSSDSQPSSTNPAKTTRLAMALCFIVARYRTESVTGLAHSIKQLFDYIAHQNTSSSTCVFTPPEHTQFTDPYTEDVYAVTRTGLSWRKKGSTTESIVYVSDLVLSALELSKDGQVALMQLESISRALRTALV